MKTYLIRMGLFITFFLGGKHAILWLGLDIAEALFWFGAMNYSAGFVMGTVVANDEKTKKEAMETNNENFGL